MAPKMPRSGWPANRTVRRAGAGDAMTSASGQTLDATRVEAGQRVADTNAGDPSVRRDFRQRHQHEGALEQARVRQGQAGLVHGEVVIGDDVDIDRARSPALLAA